MEEPNERKGCNERKGWHGMAYTYTQAGDELYLPKPKRYYLNCCSPGTVLDVYVKIYLSALCGLIFHYLPSALK